jgi:hypothetical protein
VFGRNPPDAFDNVVQLVLRHADKLAKFLASHALFPAEQHQLNLFVIPVVRLKYGPDLGGALGVFSADNLIFRTGRIVLDIEFIIIPCCAACYRHLAAKFPALSARDVSHRLGEKCDERRGTRALFFFEETGADGLMKQVALREVGAVQMAQLQPVESGPIQGGQGIDRRDHLVIDEVFRIGRRQIRDGRLGHIVHGFILRVPGRESFQTKIIESETPVSRACVNRGTGLRKKTGAGYSKNGVVTMNYIAERAHLRQSQLVGLIEEACQHLEPPAYQRDLAKQRYEGVGDWLARSDDWLLTSIEIRLQGSVAIGTTVKPIGANEHDVDLVAHVPDVDLAVSPVLLKQRIGDRLRSNGNYAALLIEMPRCWRLDYANEFHLDITPSIPNPECRFGGELVPDKTLKSWKASNPMGYRAKFERRAALLPRIRSVFGKAFDSARADAQIEPYPEDERLKGILRRIVQIAKRHRDVHFIDDDEGLAPLSIIITTLASRAYEYCVSQFEYDHELELVVDVLRRMPTMMQTDTVEGRIVWYLWNQTTAGENFCEKWNKHPERARAFFAWHSKVVADVEQLTSAQGLDQVRRLLGDIFGTAPANKAMDSLTERVSAARATSRLSVATPAGLIAGTAAGATPVRANTFFGGRR